MEPALQMGIGSVLHKERIATQSLSNDQCTIRTTERESRLSSTARFQTLRRGYEWILRMAQRELQEKAALLYSSRRRLSCQFRRIVRHMGRYVLSHHRCESEILFTLDAGELLYTVSIVTTDASAKLRWLHDRMPVLLPDEASVDLWLSREEVEWKRLEALLKPYNGEDLLYHPVTEKMGNVRFQGEECYKDIRKKGLDAFFTPTKRTKKRRQEKAEVSEAEEVSKKKIKREVKTEVKKETTIKIEVPKKEEEEMTGLTRLHGCKRSGPLQREETSPLRKSARLLKKHEIKE